eukprot:m.136563 g.136563  ORF g.136563 m.136563 type:complete len:106 (+) comp9903_c1_seq1:1075-1392(+)
MRAAARPAESSPQETDNRRPGSSILCQYQGDKGGRQCLSFSFAAVARTQTTGGVCEHQRRHARSSQCSGAAQRLVWPRQWPPSVCMDLLSTVRFDVLCRHRARLP